MEGRRTLDRLGDRARRPSVKHEPNIREFTTGLENAGINAACQMHFRDGAGGATTQCGQYLVPIVTVAVPTLGHVLTALIKARHGRKVRVKIGTLSVVAGTAAEVERLLPQLKDLQAKSTEGGKGE